MFIPGKTVIIILFESIITNIFIELFNNINYNFKIFEREVAF